MLAAGGGGIGGGGVAGVTVGWGGEGVQSGALPDPRARRRAQAIAATHPRAAAAERYVRTAGP